MISQEFFQKRIECAFNQAKVRKFIVDSGGWYLELRNGRYHFDYKRRAYPLSFFIEGRRGNYNDHNDIAAATLDVRPTITQAFSDGFCGGGYGKKRYDFESFAYNLGKSYRAKLIGGEL